MVAQPKLYTVNEFDEFLRQPENRGRLFELMNGEIIEKTPTREHGIIAGNVVTELNIYLRQNRIGHAAVEARHRPANDDHNSRLPDVSFVADPTRPIEKQGAALYIPDLCVEIKSPDDTYKEMRDTADFYLANGARMVWLIYPEKRLVEVHTPDDFDILTDNDTLDGSDVLPGFTLPARDIFQV